MRKIDKLEQVSGGRIEVHRTNVFGKDDTFYLVYDNASGQYLNYFNHRRYAFIYNIVHHVGNFFINKFNEHDLYQR